MPDTLVINPHRKLKSFNLTARNRLSVFTVIFLDIRIKRLNQLVVADTMWGVNSPVPVM